MDKVYIYWKIDDYDLYTLFTKSKFVYFNVVYSLYFVSKYIIGDTNFVSILRKGNYKNQFITMYVHWTKVSRHVFVFYITLVQGHTIHNCFTWEKSLGFRKMKNEFY